CRAPFVTGVLRRRPRAELVRSASPMACAIAPLIRLAHAAGRTQRYGRATSVTERQLPPASLPYLVALGCRRRRSGARRQSAITRRGPPQVLNAQLRSAAGSAFPASSTLAPPS